MASTTEESAPRPHTWRWYVVRLVVLLVFAALLVGAWMLYTGVTVSLQAEENLHSTLFTIRLVEQFVHDNGRWPKSWIDLEQMPFPSDAPSPLNGELTVIRIGGSHGYKWPDQSPHLRECVAIDFDADANSIISQDPMDFQAINPIGPHYEFRDYGFVKSLQNTLKESTQGGRPTSRGR